jgi:hypothetical protein
MTLRYSWGAAAPGWSPAPTSSRSREPGSGRGPVGLALAGALLIYGCNTERRRADTSPPSHEVNVATQPLRQEPGATAAGGAPPAGTPAAGAPASSIGDRPSVDENMGRDFQGTLALRVVSPARSFGLRYSSRGNSARLQVDPLEAKDDSASQHLDALIWDESISLLDHRDRTVQTFAMDSVAPRTDDSGAVEVKKTGERTMLLGVGCERYEIVDGPRRVSACVGALPGTFDIDKFETVSRIDVPPWLEELVKDELLPLQGSVRDAGGRELYSFELTEYSPGPVDATQLVLPQNYRATAAAPRAAQ